MKMYLLFLILLVTGIAAASDDAEHDTKDVNHAKIRSAGNTLYKEECGSCHLAFPPGFLPAAAWQNILANLDKHFGDNAELTPAKQTQLLHFLQKNSAMHSRDRYNSTAQLPRITTQPAFVSHHREIPTRLIRDNPAVKRLSNCGACHQHAEQASFDEHDIRIPGYGRWED